jgi:hypothetical protein
MWGLENLISPAVGWGIVSAIIAAAVAYLGFNFKKARKYEEEKNKNEVLGKENRVLVEAIEEQAEVDRKYDQLDNKIDSGLTEPELNELFNPSVDRKD